MAHRPGQFGRRALDRHAHGIAAHAGLVGDRAVVEAELDAHDEQFLAASGEAGERGLVAAQAFAAKRGLERRRRVLVDELLAGLAGDAVHGRAADLVAQDVQQQVAQVAEEAATTCVFERVEMAERTQQGDLHEVVGVGQVACVCRQASMRPAPEHRQVAGEQAFARPCIARADAMQQFLRGIGHGVHARPYSTRVARGPEQASRCQGLQFEAGRRHRRRENPRRRRNERLAGKGSEVASARLVRFATVAGFRGDRGLAGGRSMLKIHALHIAPDPFPDLARCARLLLAPWLVCGAVAMAAPGDLDPAFGTGGFVRDAMGSNGGAVATAVAIDASGRIVVSGSVGENAINGDFGVLRLVANGDLDAGFGVGGRAIAGRVAASDEEAYGLVIQADGRLVVAGTSFLTALGTRSVALRLNADGAIDGSFGNQGDGWFLNPRVGDDVSLALAAGSAGFAIAGYAGDGLGGIDASALRLDTLGMPLPLFGDAGFVIAASDTSSARAVALQADGKLLIAGTLDGDEAAAFVQRFDDDGGVDAGFAGDGRAELAAPSRLVALAVQGDGRIVAAGLAGNDAIVVRLLADGSPDPSFGSGGTVTLAATSFGLTSLRAQALALLADGRIVVGGRAFDFSQGTTGFAARLLAGGSLDPAFAGSGLRVVDAPTDIEFRAVALQADGAVVLAGIDYGASATGTDDQFLVVRLQGGGAAGGPLTFSVGDASVVEGDAGTTLMNFIVTLSAPSPGGVGVTAQTDLGSAAPNVDYTPTGAFLTFDQGVSTVNFQVPVIGDLVDEPDETFLVRLIDPAGATIADGVATGTIINDDTSGTVEARPLPGPGALALGLLAALLAAAGMRSRHSRRH